MSPGQAAIGSGKGSAAHCWLIGAVPPAIAQEERVKPPPACSKWPVKMIPRMEMVPSFTDSEYSMDIG